MSCIICTLSLPQPSIEYELQGLRYLATANNIVLANATRIVSLCQSVRGFLLGTELYLGEVLVPRSPNNGDTEVSPTPFEGSPGIVPIPFSSRRPPCNETFFTYGKHDPQTTPKDNDTPSTRLNLQVQGSSEGSNELAIQFQTNCSLENLDPRCPARVRQTSFD